MLAMQSVDDAKRRAAQKGLDFIEDGMVVGLGSGSTATEFIRLLGDKVRNGLKVRGIPSSSKSEELARSLSIPLTDFEQTPEIDVTVDGADEVAPSLALIKGGGGALLREKIVASASRKFVVVADSRKVVDTLGKFPLPVEVIPMAGPLVLRKLDGLGIRPKVRKTETGASYITDEGNLIMDCACGEIADPEKLASSISAIVGVVEHGLFVGMADLALIAGDSGVTEMRPSRFAY